MGPVTSVKGVPRYSMGEVKVGSGGSAAPRHFTHLARILHPAYPVPAWGVRKVCIGSEAWHGYCTIGLAGMGFACGVR